MRKSLQGDHAANPELILYQMIEDYVQGRLDANRVLYRACVLKIDQKGGQLEVNPPNPRNCIKARIVTSGYNAYTPVKNLPVFWPMFPHLQQPVKEGEHVYVMFEDDNRTHGLWLTRIPQRFDTDSKNYADGNKPYLLSAGTKASNISIDRLVAGTPKDPASIIISKNFVIEPVPEFEARVGDQVIHGSNNTIIVLGRDRTGTVDEPAPTGSAGSIDIVAGRASTDMDMMEDESRIYCSRHTDADVNFETEGLPTDISPADSGATNGMKSDYIRIVGRKNVKIVSLDGDLTIEAPNINIGKQPLPLPGIVPQHAVLGDDLVTLLQNMMTAIQNLVVLTPAGPSTPPVAIGPAALDSEGNAITVASLGQQIQAVISSTVKVKA